MAMIDFTRDEVLEIIQTSLKLKGANLASIDLSEANLNYADLRGADLQGADLSGTKYNKSTKFPESFDPEEAGMVLVE